MKGHAYFLFDPAHLDGAARVDADRRGGAYLVGDSLGLAQPLTAEGILPAVVSGRLAAEAILAGAPADYPARLAAHPVLADYRRVCARHCGAAARARATASSDRAPSIAAAEAPRALLAGAPGQRALSPTASPGCSRARGCPRRRLIDVGLDGAERWLARGAGREAPSEEHHGNEHRAKACFRRWTNGAPPTIIREALAARRRHRRRRRRPGTSGSTTRACTSGCCATGRSASARPSSKAGGTATRSIR